jgi:hypothetical protein
MLTRSDCFSHVSISFSDCMGNSLQYFHMIDHPTAINFLVLLLTEPQVSYEILVSVLWSSSVQFLSPLVIPPPLYVYVKHMAKIMATQAAVLSLSMFSVLTHEQNEMLSKSIESSREKHIVQY